jgi:adenosine deaminase
MKKRSCLANLFCLLLTLSFLSPAFADVTSHFETIKSDPNALYAFFKEMPKGGELHYHLAGGAYPETMLMLAAHGDYCLKPGTQDIVKKEPCDGIQASTLDTKPEVYKQIIRAWSMKDFVPGKESGHDHFFASFYKFIPLVHDFRPQLLAEIMKRAADQHELYLEITLSPDNNNSLRFASLIEGPIGLAAKQRKLLADKDFQKNLELTLKESDLVLPQARRELGCDTLPDQPVCHLTVTFQYEILREQSLDAVFAQALTAFATADKSHDLIAVNLVQPEDGIISLRDYREQMRIFKFLHTAYPKVHITLHAGELAAEDVLPADLRFHIHDAIFIGQAERIGHGADIAYEDNAENLLNYMAKKPIAVEINLVSNRVILNLYGKKHPLNYYLSHQVPVILSTDDEGILRTDLTRQYVEAATQHDLAYATIKNITRNALTYSFLPGNSIWTNTNKATLIQDCKDLDSKNCQQYIKENEKARLQWQLEKKLAAFEKQFTEKHADNH